MLEFIVLGQIPGTSIRISFNEVLIIGGSLLVGIEVYRIIQRKRKFTSNSSIKEVNA